MRALLIAEKPSLKSTIQEVYNHMKFTDTIDFVSLAGHVVGLKEPRDYNVEKWKAKSWSYDMLPFMPDPFEYKVLPDKRKLYNDITTKIKNGNYDYLINACDPDREGNYIFHLLYTHSKCKLPVKRFWTNDLNTPSVEHALRNLRTNDDGLLPNLTNLTQAAILRARFDELVGMNFTIAETLHLNQLAKIGRVKSVTLCICGKREEEIMNFKPKTTYALSVLYKEGFEGTLFNKDGDVVVEDKKEFTKIISELGKTAFVEKIDKKREKSYAPQLYNMAAIQADAGNTFGYDAIQTLDLVQSLYEKKLCTYPRADCPYISSEQTRKFDAILDVIGSVPEFATYRQNITNDDKRRISTSKTYVNDAELAKSGHSAIIPTEKVADFKTLSNDEKNVLLMIYKRFLAIFMPPIVTDKTLLITNNNNYTFKTNGKMLVDPGYSVLYNTNFKDVDLPKLNEKDIVNVNKFDVKERITKPPKRYTDADLILVMEKPGNFLEDEHLKAIMKEKKGIGTEATRASIINELEKNGYIEKRKGKGKSKTIYVTPIGMFIHQHIKDKDFAAVDLTGIWETKLDDISNGKMKFEDFEKEMKVYVLEGIENIKNDEQVAQFQNATEIIGMCPKCRTRKVKSTNKYYACEGYKNDCDFIFGKQIYGAKISAAEAKKIIEGKETKELSMKKDDKSWTASLWYNPENQKVEFTKRKLDFGKCPACDGFIKGSKDYFLCSNYPNQCKFIVPKNYFGAKITEDDITKLINGQPTRMLKMKKDEKTWQTTLSFLPDKKQVGFTPREPAKAIGTCPCCGGNIVDTERGYICENYKKSCSIYIAKDMYGARIPLLEVKKLLLGKETKEFSMQKDDKKWVTKLKYNPTTKKIEFFR